MWPLIVLSDASKYTLPVALANLSGEHVQDTELMMAGSRFQQKGYQTFWVPGRHQLGSNWFWYFNSPLGCHIEYDADMDQHDDHWQPREALPGADNSQYFLLGYREKWAPGPDNAR